MYISSEYFMLTGGELSHSFHDLSLPNIAILRFSCLVSTRVHMVMTVGFSATHSISLNMLKCHQ